MSEVVINSVFGVLPLLFGIVIHKSNIINLIKYIQYSDNVLEFVYIYYNVYSLNVFHSPLNMQHQLLIEVLSQ